MQQPIEKSGLAARRQHPDAEALELAVADVAGGPARREGAQAGVG